MPRIEDHEAKVFARARTGKRAKQVNGNFSGHDANLLSPCGILASEAPRVGKFFMPALVDEKHKAMRMHGKNAVAGGLYWGNGHFQLSIAPIAVDMGFALWVGK
jgi:hypothetical protein